MAEMSKHGDGPGTRRELLRRGAVAGAAGLGLWASSKAGARSGQVREIGVDGASTADLIIRNRVPLDAETQVVGLDSWITPNDRFFVRSHFGAPATALIDWSLEVIGMVERPLVLTLEELGELEQVTRPAVLQCAGNGRGLFRPNIPGIGWEKGAVGNAQWTGVRLADLLDRAGVKSGAAHLHLLGADTPPNPKTPPFLRSLPLAKALDPTTLVATLMNGEPLPELHGGPIRLIVPCWTANHAVKWLRSITVSDAEAPGFYQQTGYRIPREMAPPGSLIEDPDAEVVPVTALNVKSLIGPIGNGEGLRAGNVPISGVAWTGPGRITAVEVAVDDAPWRPATLGGQDVEGSWRTWRFDWEASPGRHLIRARATDSHGATQPEASPWNKSGYLWNSIDRAEVDIA